jgi:AcrR family transcriptional regulator
MDGQRTSHGPEERREPLSQERIVAAAIALADRQGLDALSMRRLGNELGGFEAMSLYRYFSSKAELMDAVVAGVWGEMSLPDDEKDPWERLRKLAWSWRALAHSHPHVFPLLAARSVRSPSGLRPIAFTFQTFKDAGFGEEEAGHAFMTLVGYVYGYALREIEGEGARNFDVERLPSAFGVIGELAWYIGHLDGDHVFEWGLRTVINGLRAELESPAPRSASAPPSPSSVPSSSTG